jgi:hypothetical protein
MSCKEGTVTFSHIPLQRNNKRRRKNKKGRLEIGIEEIKGIRPMVVDNKGLKKTCN